MYAVIQTGGKQYKVREGYMIEVERIKRPEGENFDIEEVLFYRNNEEVEIGVPFLKDFSVNCTVVNHYKGKKKIAFKYKRRKGSESKKGHRQKLTQLEINKINVPE